MADNYIINITNTLDREGKGPFVYNIHNVQH